MFSIPYNGAIADDYLSVIAPYGNYIDSIFFGLSSLQDEHPRFKNKKIAEENTLNFLSKNIPYKRLLTLNKAHYWMSDKEIFSFCENDVFPIMEKYHIEGAIVSHYTMAKYIHYHMPNIELQTSCNTFMYNIHAMQLWKENCGISVFNPPRDILRMPKLLEKMHDCGFKLKCIVNESCKYGCTQQMAHCFSGYHIHGSCLYECNHLQDESDVLRCNWILPRWLTYLDPYVDIYKIVGRGAPLDRISSMLDAYINERDDIYLDDFIYGGVYRGLHYNIPTNVIPDKLLTCGCADCNIKCSLCNQVIESVTKANYNI
jgi:hypothetical protein